MHSNRNQDLAKALYLEKHSMPACNERLVDFGSARIRMNVLAFAAMQVILAPALLAWHPAAYAQTCSPTTTPVSDPQPTLEDVYDGVVMEADPDANTVKDNEGNATPDAVVSPTNTNGSPDDGDQGDGGTAPGTPAGTDGGGSDSSASVSFSVTTANGIQGFTTTESDSLFGPVGGFTTVHYSIVSDPIDVARADKMHVQVDYASQGAAQLRMARVYHSNSTYNASAVKVNMGAGWHMYYDRSLQSISVTAVRLHRANGQAIDFALNGSTWTSAYPTGVLTQISGGWTYVNRRDGIETYDVNGRLVGMAHAGLALTMQYDGAGHLVKVVNPFGRALSLAYDASGRVSAVTLPGGGGLRYGYDSQSNLVSTQFADGSTRQYTYENPAYPHALTGVVDESGRRRLTWTYDAGGRPSGGYYGAGTGSVNIGYNGSQVTTVDSRGTQRVRSIGTVAGRQVLTSLSTSATASSAATNWSFNYDGSGNPQTITSRTGEVQQISSDARGRVMSATRAAGTPQAAATQVSWHPTFHVPTQVVRAGITNNYTVDASGRITQVLSVSGSSSIVTYSATYNAQNLLQSTTDARGTTLSYTYDASGNLASVANNALGQTTFFSGYNAHGQPATIQRPDGTTVTRSFDNRGRITARTDSGGTTSFTYDAAGRVAQITASDGSWTNRTYDSAGLLSSVSNNRGEITSFARDAAGAVTGTSVYSAAGILTAQSKRTIDPVGRTSAIVDSRGYATQMLYGADGRLMGATDPLGRTTSVQLDPLNRPVSVTQPNTTAMRQAGGAATTSSQFAYTAANNALNVVDTHNVATAYNYDGFNRRLSEGGNDAGGIGMVRNTAGDVTSHTDALGTTLGLTRDAIGRVTAITYAGTPDRTFSYVPGRADGLLAAITDSFGSSAGWTYDSAGRMLSQQQTVYGLQQSLRVTRDTLGRPTSMSYPSGMVLGLSYNADVVSTMTINGSTLLNTIAYRPQSSVATSWRWGNGTAYARSFDADGRMTSVTLGTVQRAYGYDAAGHVTTEADTGPAGTTQSTFSYDEAGQLIGYASPIQSVTYTYDTNGNRQGQAGSLGASSYSYLANSNRISSSADGTYQYNADGTPTTNLAPLQYNFYGQMSQLSSSSVRVLNNYNALGQRDLVRYYQYVNCSPGGGIPNVARHAAISQSTMTPATCTNWPLTHIIRYMYDDQNRLIGEYDSITGYSQETVWFNNLPVATVINGAAYYVNSDNIGAPRSIVRASDNVEMWRWDSDPFGSTPPTAPNPAAGTIVYNLRFPGQVAAAGVRYYQNGARDYSPATGRYLEPDPSGLKGGLSRYSYASGNPISFTDPIGLLSIVGQVGGSAVKGGGVEGAVGVYITLPSRGVSFDIGLYSSGGVGGGYNVGAGWAVGGIKGDVNDIRGITTNLNGGLTPIGGTVMFDDKGPVGAVIGPADQVGLSVTHADTGAVSLGEFGSWLGGKFYDVTHKKTCP